MVGHDFTLAPFSEITTLRNRKNRTAGTNCQTPETKGTNHLLVSYLFHFSFLFCVTTY